MYITQTIVGTSPDIECLKKKTNSQLVSGQIPRMGIHPHMKRTIRIHRTKTHTRMGTPVYETHYRTSRACLIAPSLLVYFDVQHYGGSLHIEISRVYVGLVGGCSVRVFDENVIGNKWWCDRRCVFWVTITNTSGRKRFLSLLIYRTRHHDHRCVFVWFSKTLSYWPPELLRLCVWVS